MQTSDLLTELCKKYMLGEIQKAPRPVEGGLLHRMYHVVTNQGDYAVKLLNPDIMKRPDALRNMVNSECIAQYMAEYGAEDTAGPTAMSASGIHRSANAIPVAAALKFRGQHLLCLEYGHRELPTKATNNAAKQYAFVYPWLDARSLFAPEIRIIHCRKIGHILGQIHAAKLEPEKLPYKLEREDAKRPLYDWQGYLTLAQSQQVPWLSQYEAMLPDLCRWDQKAVDAMETVHSCQVISHRDLDPKNVLWQGEQPILIDWEAAGYVNPYQELLEVLQYWGCDGDGRYDPALCQALLQAYTQSMELREVDWAPIFACSCDGMLGWLEYTLKKSLGLEGDEAAQGPQQMLATYRDLQRYEAQAGQLWEMVTPGKPEILASPGQIYAGGGAFTEKCYCETYGKYQ